MPSRCEGFANNQTRITSTCRRCGAYRLPGIGIWEDPTTQQFPYRTFPTPLSVHHLAYNFQPSSFLTETCLQNYQSRHTSHPIACKAVTKNIGLNVLVASRQNVRAWIHCSLGAFWCSTSDISCESGGPLHRSVPLRLRPQFLRPDTWERNA